uniref:Nanos-type domain-containing protein n=1 Tax=Caenorhabditis tropicalis TaxID=1561998 RepID=A0A1I7UQV3_9PELO
MLFGKANMPTSTMELIGRSKELSRNENLFTELFKNKNAQNQPNTTMLSQQNNNKTKPQRDQRNHNNGQRKQNDATGFKVSTPCAFCVEDKFLHQHILCKRFNTVDSRMDQARELHLCFRCLKPGHSFENMSTTLFPLSRQSSSKSLPQIPRIKSIWSTLTTRHSRFVSPNSSITHIDVSRH